MTKPTPDSQPTCPNCGVKMVTAYAGQSTTFYVCPCCAGTMTIPPAGPLPHVPPVPQEKR